MFCGIEVKVTEDAPFTNTMGVIHTDLDITEDELQQELVVRVITEEGATWRRRNFHVVFLDQFFMGNKKI